MENNNGVTLIISSDGKTASLFCTLGTTRDCSQWRVTLAQDGAVVSATYHKGKDEAHLWLKTGFLSFAEDLGSRFLDGAAPSNLSWDAAEVRRLCPAWNDYTVYLCWKGQISVSGPNLPDYFTPAEIKDSLWYNRIF